MRDFLTRVGRVLRHGPDRAAHAVRRAAAKRTVEGVGQDAVLFVCHGNICRSPFAAGVFASLSAEAFPNPPGVSSAGFVSPGKPAPPQAIAAAARRGIDLTGHRSRLLTPRVVRDFTLVVVMAPEQAGPIRRLGSLAPSTLVLGDLDPLPILNRTVRDPYGASDDVFDESYDRIQRCVRELVRLMAHARSVELDSAHDRLSPRGSP